MIVGQGRMVVIMGEFDESLAQSLAHSLPLGRLEDRPVAATIDRKGEQHNATLDYICRPEELNGVCWWDFVSRYHKINLKQAGRQPGNVSQGHTSIGTALALDQPGLTD
jgi:hypothetical protein